MVPRWIASAVDGPPDRHVKWVADENFDNDILRGVRRRTADFDVVSVQDIAEISALGDPAVLAWAAANNRAVLTHDLSTMFSGVIYVPLG